MNTNLNFFRKIENQHGLRYLVSRNFHTVEKIKESFLSNIERKQIHDLVYASGFYNNKEYLSFILKFTRSDVAIFAFRIENFSNSEILIESLWFEKSGSIQSKNQMKAFGKVVGNVVIGFLGPGRSIVDEIDLIKNIGHAASGGGVQGLEDKYHLAAEMVFMSLNQSLKASLDQFRSKNDLFNLQYSR